MFRQHPILFLLLAAAILLVIPGRAAAQRFLGGISAGMNLTQVDGDDYYGFNKAGLNVGPMVSLAFGKNKHWSASLELLYSQKGSRHYSSDPLYRYALKQDYAEVPVLFHFTDKEVISGGLGFSYGRLINHTETKNAVFDTLYQYKNSLSYDDFSVIAELQFRLWYRLWAGLRYQYSLKSNRTVVIDKYSINGSAPEERDQYNNVITLRLTWIFNQAKREKSPKSEIDSGEE